MELRKKKKRITNVKVKTAKADRKPAEEPMATPRDPTLQASAAGDPAKKGAPCHAALLSPVASPPTQRYLRVRMGEGNI